MRQQHEEKLRLPGSPVIPEHYQLVHFEFHLAALIRFIILKEVENNIKIYCTWRGNRMEWTFIYLHSIQLFPRVVFILAYDN